MVWKEAKTPNRHFRYRRFSDSRPDIVPLPPPLPLQLPLSLVDGGGRGDIARRCDLVP